MYDVYFVKFAELAVIFENILVYPLCYFRMLVSEVLLPVEYIHSHSYGNTVVCVNENI